MAVVVQRMVFPQAAGILFTADPVTGNRKVASVEASFGLGEALVSGLVNADIYTVRDGEIVARAIGAKKLAIHARPAGGTEEEAIEPERQEQPALTDAQVVRLVQLGRRIEAHFGRPQDIEWCLVDDGFQIVQSRPITTLFPIPAAGDQENHVYVSVGHGQMMTDAMKPLGLSFFLLTTRAPMVEAGGRLFVDVTARLASSATRAGLLEVMGKGDPLIRDALETVLERGDFIRSLPDEAPGGPPAGAARRARAPAPIETDPAIVADLIARNQASIAALKRDIRTKSGTALLDFILADIQELRRLLFDPQSNQVFMSAMEAAWWLNDQLLAWLGEKNAADTLTQSVPNNVTSEMGLALLDVADVIRPHPDVVAFLEHVEGEGFLDELPTLAGGREARDAIRAWLDRYGMRCVGEIDITRPRWSERPSTLLPLILGNVRNFEPGAGERRFEEGRQEAEKKERERAGAPAGSAGRGAEGRRGEVEDRPGPHLHRLPGVSEVRHGQPLLRVQAGLAGRSRAPRRGRRASREGRHLLPQVRGDPGRRPHPARRRPAHPRAQGGVRVVSGAHAAPRAHVGRRGRRREVPTRRCAGRRARRLAGLRRDRSRGGPASSSTWRRPISKPATSSSRPSRIRAGRRCSSRSRGW